VTSHPAQAHTEGYDAHAGEMHVNIGGDPERDDYGLPPVDIEVPDDARDLARDVQAYHRELRAKRRHKLLRRLRGPLARDGMVLPLLASCLALALLIGATVTMFSTARFLQVPGQPTAAARAQTPPAGRASPQALPPVPDKTVQVGGKPIRLRSLVPAVLALIPSGCDCANAVRQLSAQAAAAGVPIYLVGTAASMTEVETLATRSGQNSAHVVDDAGDVLGSTYDRTGLTAVLVYANGSISEVVRRLGPGIQLASRLGALMPTGPQGVARPQRAA
jgi:hypothetical protein